MSEAACRPNGRAQIWFDFSALLLLESPSACFQPCSKAIEGTSKGLVFSKAQDLQDAAIEPLRGKTVKILTVQNASVGTSGTSSRAKLEFAKSLFDKQYAELTQAPTSAAGVVVIFDSEDGGMAAATLSTLQQWKAGSLSDQAFWRRCFFDPAETFVSQKEH